MYTNNIKIPLGTLQEKKKAFSTISILEFSFQNLAKIKSFSCSHFISLPFKFLSQYYIRVKISRLRSFSSRNLDCFFSKKSTHLSLCSCHCIGTLVIN